MLTTNSQWALITGATSGFGKATAELLAKNGCNLVLTGRRNDRLDQMKSSLEKMVKVETLCFDVQKEKDTKDAWQSLPEDVRNGVAILVNNAGLALGRNNSSDGEMADWNTMFDTNVKGILHVTQAVLPSLKQNRGQIINIGSIAGKEVYPNNNHYCTSKFAVYGLTQTMRIDFAQFGIRVTHIAPGAAQTEFSEVRFKGDEHQANAVYDGFQPLQAEDIAETILYVINRPQHVNINDIVIMPTAQPSAQNVIR